MSRSFKTRLAVPSLGGKLVTFVDCNTDTGTTTHSLSCAFGNHIEKWCKHKLRVETGRLKIGYNAIYILKIEASTKPSSADLHVDMQENNFTLEEKNKMIHNRKQPPKFCLYMTRDLYISSPSLPSLLSRARPIQTDEEHDDMQKPSSSTHYSTSSR